jgi:ParB family transcriptional regulator, chromosome partitioning protein
MARSYASSMRLLDRRDMTAEYQRIQMASIDVSAMNARKNMEAGSEDAGIADLANSIASLGLQNPPTLRPSGNGEFEVVSGQRRVMACRQLGWTEIDALVSEMTDEQALSASLVENVQRADMDPIDKARGFDQLARMLGSEREVAKTLGLSIKTVNRYLSLLTLPEDIRSVIGTGNGPSGIGAMAELAQRYGGNDDAARTAFQLVDGFKGGMAAELLRRSDGDLDELRSLRDDALEGKFDIKRCGVSLSTCPWILDLPESLQSTLLALVPEK